MYNKHYARGYLRMAVKCAQFTYSAPRLPESQTVDVKSYFSVPDSVQAGAVNLQSKLNDVYKARENRRWWRPSTWWSGSERQERNVKKEIEAYKEQMAKQIAKSHPVSRGTAEVFGRYGMKFMNVMPGNNATQKSIYDSILGGLKNPDVFRHFTMPKPRVG